MHRRARAASTLVVAVTLLVVSIVGAPIVAAEQTSSINVPVAHIEGRGHGHGVGMSQWGAYSMAEEGSPAAQILAQFYPGTELGNAGGEVAVVIERADRVAVRFPGGGEIRSAREGEQAAGFPVTVAPGAVVELVRDGGGYTVVGGSVSALSASGSATPYQADDCFLVLCRKPVPEPEPEPGPTTTTTTAPPGDGSSTTRPDRTTTTTGPSSPRSGTPLWAVAADGGTVESVGRGRTYRGVFSFGGPQGGAALRNHVDVEQYLKGMGEVPATWPAAAVQAQAIAARTFALRAMAAGGEICDSASCQVYGGVAYEKAGQSAAVDATRGVVVTFGGALAGTFYSASGGGHSATVAEGFGSTGDVPYLPARPYPTVNPQEWAVDIALTDVAARLGYPGTISDVRVDETGPSGRALRMTIVGDAGEVPVHPQDFRRKLGLRSTLFTVESSEAEDPPPPPPELSEAPDVVGTDAEASGQDWVSPVRRPMRSLEAPIRAELTPAPAGARIPLPLLAVAASLIALTAAVGAGHVTSRRRLHPVFALASAVTDVTRARLAPLARAPMRGIRRGLATMTRWTIRRR